MTYSIISVIVIFDIIALTLLIFINKFIRDFGYSESRWVLIFVIITIVAIIEYSVIT